MPVKPINKLKALPKYRPSFSMLAVMFVLTVVMIAASNAYAEQNTPPPTDKSISMVLKQTYENKIYEYICNPTLESQKKFKITRFGGEAEISGNQKGAPPPPT